MRAFSFHRLGLAGIVAAGLAAGAADATIKDGVDAWQSGDFSRAINEWRGPADAGDADAQFNLGQAYKLGRGVTADLAIAQSWYEKAAKQGHEQAQANLGLILFQNGNRAAAMPWISKAAEHGEPRAQYVLGTALFNGDFAPKDWPRAYALMTRAAAAGLPQASNSLAEMDKYIPLGQRQQGVAIARTLTDSNAAPAATVAPAALAANVAVPPPSAPRTIRQVQLPPSTPAQAEAAAPAPVRPAPPPRASKAMLPPPAPAPVAPVEAKPAPAPVPKAVPALAAPVPKAASALAAAGGKWRVQLGAFATPGSAEAAWAKFSGALPGLSPIYTKAGAVTRVQAGPLGNKAAADQACNAAKAAGGSCIPIAP